MKRALILAAALAACAPSGEPQPVPNPTPTPASAPADASLPAPTPSDVAVRIGAAQNGQRIEVGIGQRFAVELVGVPTAGYIWAVTQAPAFVGLTDAASGATNEAQNQPGFAGGNHWEVFVFTAASAGAGEIVFEQRRPWESNEPPNNTFRVTIVAR